MLQAIKAHLQKKRADGSFMRSRIFNIDEIGYMCSPSPPRFR